ncbi:MAG: CPBP family intramembrane metalloprotease [Sedimentisphaerales bacterium]|nr:CPBP family intramembrane metalloprotease [Sedimentisphaerales bacterium]
MDTNRDNISFTDVSVLLEILFVTVASIGMIVFLRNKLNNDEAWLALTSPFILISAAIIPTLIHRKDLSQIGFQTGHFQMLLRILPIACMLVFSVLFLGILILSNYNIPLPMRAIIPKNRWLEWIVYQFMCVAVPEELFFRGYLQTNVITLLTTVKRKKFEVLGWIGIIICAIVFAASHVVIFKNGISIVTFFPGLFFGWLFYKTKSLLAPVLFHGLANISYGIIAEVLT